jgi:hypothetical protein
MNLLESIFNAMKTDDCNKATESEKLIRIYETSAKSERRAIDLVMCYVCGYSLETLIEDLEA